MLGSLSIREVSIRFIALIFTMVVHELAHGYTALYFGDKTAKYAGRLSLNPLNHINPVGLISLIIFKFGWANPVPVNFSNLRPRKVGVFCVSIAGVTTNLMLGLIFTLVYTFCALSIASTVFGKYVLDLLIMLVVYNVSFAVFNILPIPPLDGSKIIINFLPLRIQNYIYRYERYLYFILVFLIFSGLISKVMGPIVNAIILFYSSIASWLFNVY